MRTALFIVGCLALTANLRAQTPSPPANVDSTALAELPDLRATLLLDASEYAEREPGDLVPGVHRALFCRFDDALDRRRIPLRMRLGTLEAVNEKEGKPGYTLLRN